MKIKLLFAFLLMGITAFGQQNPIQIDANGLTQTLAAGGIVNRGQIVKINSAGQVVPVATTDTSGAIGVAATSQQNQGQSISVSIGGTPLVQIDSGGCAAGNFVGFSTTIGGAGHCSSTAGTTQIGIALSISSPGSNFWNVALTVGGGGGGGIPGQFSVKTYGAVGDTKASRNCATSAASKIVTNPDNPWTAADVGKFMEIVAPAQGADVFTAARKIASFQSAGQVTMDTLQDGTATPTSGQNCKWFTQDDTAAFQAAFTAAQVSLASADPSAGSPTLAYSGTVACPPGGYTVSSTIFYDGKSNSTTNLGVGLKGPSGGGCVIYPTAGFVGVTDTACSGIKTGLISTCNTIRTDIEDILIQGHGILLPSGVLPVGQGFLVFSHCKTCTVKNVTANDIGMANANTYVIYLLSASGHFQNNYFQNGAVGAADSECRIENSTSVLWESTLCSNAPASSLVVVASGSRGSGSSQLTLLNDDTDECGGSAGTVPCTSIQSSIVNYVGGVSFGGLPEIMTVDGTSQVYFTDHNIQEFGSPTNNAPSIVEVAGSYVEATGSTLASNGTGAIVSGPSTATFVDTGGNTFLNCAAGVCTAITAANFATKGFSGGIIPKSTQTHTPNTCYAVTGNLLATAQNLCIVLLDQNYQLLNMTAQSGGTTPTNSSCATPPVITLSDGTRSATMTMTTGKTQWFSNVDAVTNINQIFASGATLTVSIGANTCATPPANVSVNYNLQSAINP